MLGLDERALRITWTVFLFGLLLALIYFIRSTLLLFAIAIFFAYILWPIISLIERFMPKRRTAALAIVYILLVGSLVGAGFVVVPAIAAEATSLMTRLPSMVMNGGLTKMPIPAFLAPVREQVMAALSKGAVNLENSVVPFIQRSGSEILSGLSFVLPMVLVPILAFFFLKDGRELLVSVIGSVDDGHDRNMMEAILEDVHIVLSKYIRALVLLAIASFAAWWLFLSIMGYHYELLLAGLAGILEFIPVIGPATALVIMLIVCIVAQAGGLLWILVFWGCFRIFQDYVLRPYLMSSGVELHPLLVLFGVLAGDAIAGIPGMFFSVPTLAILRVIYLHLRTTYSRKQLTANV
jgi:predicted PurR-regulated permease PerM